MPQPGHGGAVGNPPDRRGPRRRPRGRDPQGPHPGRRQRGGGQPEQLVRQPDADLPPSDQSGGGMNALHYGRALNGIVTREVLRFLHQRERFLAALVRPLVWLLVFAAGFRAALGVSIIPPYETYITYETYIIPGLVGMIQLFNGMQSSLSMVYDREMGSMRTLLVSPFPRWYLLICKLSAGVAVSILQVYVFLLIAWFWEVEPPFYGYMTVIPALILTGLMLGSLGLLLSSLVKQLENFAGIMNFV